VGRRRLAEPPSAEHRVASAEEIARLVELLRPGDALVLADGTWEDQRITFRGQGTADAPITLRARTPGKVLLVGQSSLSVEGEHLVVSGLHFGEGAALKDGVKVAGRHCRLTESAMVGCSYKYFARLAGAENRVDHCYFAGKATESPTLQVEVEGKPNRHRVDHNHFGPRPPLGRNGGETIRVGDSEHSLDESGTVVERNLFERCDGEIEVVSNKSCGNVYRSNTFLECAGMLTLRHGNRCVVEGNVFLGRHKKRSGGVRIIGEGHTVVNNYVEGVARGGFWLTSGVPDTPLNGYARARDILIAFNTVVDSSGPCIDLDNGHGEDRRTLRPEAVTVANNIFSVPAGGTLLRGTEGEGFAWMGNFAWADPAPADHRGVRVLDPRLERSDDGLSRPTGDSPVRGGAKGRFDAAATDIDGQDRGPRPDSAATQISRRHGAAPPPHAQRREGRRGRPGDAATRSEAGEGR
jgi:poly(beta-D-mannuronate) lyase